MHIGVLAFDDPWASRHGGTLRTRAFVEGFAALGHSVTCVYAGAVGPPGPLAGQVTAIGVPGRPVGEGRVGGGRVGSLKRHYLPLPTVRGGNIADLTKAVLEHRPYDVFVVQQLRGLPYAEAADCSLWLDQTDVWSRFLNAEIEVRRRAARLTARAQQTVFRRLEAKSAARAAVVTAAGAGDASELERSSGRAVQWLPTPIAPSETAAPRGGGGVPTAGLLANFAYWPNRDAFDLLAYTWLPALREAGWNVLVAGLDASKLPSVPGITNLGEVGAISEFYGRVDVCLSPVRLGAGVKVKVVEALMAGRPVIATPESSDGFPAQGVPGVHVVDTQIPVFPSPAEMKLVRTLVRPEIAEHFAPEGFRETLQRLLTHARVSNS